MSATLAFWTVPTTSPEYGLRTSNVPLPPATISPAMRIFSCRGAAARDSGSGNVALIFLAPAVSDMVEGEIENVEIAQASARRTRLDRAVEHQRHALLGNAAMRTQRRIEAREIVARGRGADRGIAHGDDDDVTHAIFRQLETLA